MNDKYYRGNAGYRIFNLGGVDLGSAGVVVLGSYNAIKDYDPETVVLIKGFKASTTNGLTVSTFGTIVKKTASEVDIKTPVGELQIKSADDKVKLV